MPVLRILTSGESHGPALMGIIDGLPSGLNVSADAINIDLKRRQGGHGRGGRMKIESDSARILSGVRWGKTIGSPVTLMIENKDFANWDKAMSPDAAHAGSIAAVTRPRPGHADLTGAMKYGHHDIRNVLERSSARETAMRVAIGAVCKIFLKEFGIDIGSFVVSIGPVSISPAMDKGGALFSLFKAAENSPVRCPDEGASKEMMAAIDEASKQGDTLGGTFIVFATGAPAGLGSHAHYDRKLDGLMAQALMSIQAIKAVECGAGFDAAAKKGSDVMDVILKTDAGYGRATNNAGGIEGGMTNGMPIILRAAMKPIPTLKRPLKSVDISTGETIEAAYERSDVCAVPAAAVIGEAMCAMVLAGAVLDKFGGDSMAEILSNHRSYLEGLKRFGK